MYFCYRGPVRVHGSTFSIATLLLFSLLSGQAAHAQEFAPEDAAEAAEIEVITEPPAQPPPAAPVQSTTVRAPAVEAPPKSAPTVIPKPIPEEPFGRLRVGGGIGFGFGSDVTFFSVAPQVSYIIKNIVEPGVTVRYQYSRDRFPEPDVKWNTFGSSLFVRLFPIRSLFFLVEGELINTGFKQGDFQSGRTNYGNLFLGGGYLFGFGRGAFAGVSIKVNVFRNDFYPTNFPIFSVGGGYAF